MRFALCAEDQCGDERTALAVARAAAVAPDHALVSIVGRPGPGLPPLAPRGRYCPSWEDLLANAEVDAVIISGAADELQPAVRQLVQAGKAVLLPPELLQPAAFFYEMALVEAEAPGRLFPLLGLRGHPLVQKLRELIARQAFGWLRHGQLDRQIAGPTAAQPLFTNDDLALALLTDADLLRALCGTYDQVTASRSGDAARGFSLATVTLAGNAVPQVVWTASATGGAGELRLTLVGDSGTAILEGDPASTNLRLTVALPGEPPTTEENADDAGAWLLETFAASIGEAEPRGGHGGSSMSSSTAGAVARGEHRAETAQRPATLNVADSLWDELARAVELVDAVERSVRRRRTIDVYFETPSERGIFKTQMTAVGCSLLVLTLIAVVIYLGVAAAVAVPPLVKKVVVGFIFVPLGVFLVMQLLYFVARPATRDGR